MIPDYVKRVTYSKYLLARAKFLHKEANELSSAEAVLVMHDAAEMLMRVITDHLGVNPSDKFMDFWKLVKDKTGSEPPRKGAMDRLNNLRVGFKHKGNLPNSNVVADLIPLVTDFCTETAEQYLGIDYEAMSLTDLIPNSQARDKVREAEKAKADGDIPRALLALGVAFDTLHYEAYKRDSLGLISKVSGRYDWDHGAAVAINKVVETVNMLILGIHPPKLRRFSVCTPIRTYAESGAMQVVWTHDPNRLSAGDYEFCHQFVIEFALRLVLSS
jgi:hypothetical protein